MIKAGGSYAQPQQPNSETLLPEQGVWTEGARPTGEYGMIATGQQEHELDTGEWQIQADQGGAWDVGKGEEGGGDDQGAGGGEYEGAEQFGFDDPYLEEGGE